MEILNNNQQVVRSVLFGTPTYGTSKDFLQVLSIGRETNKNVVEFKEMFVMYSMYHRIVLPWSDYVLEHFETTCKRDGGIAIGGLITGFTISAGISLVGKVPVAPVQTLRYDCCSKWEC